ncbi:hypothetical protein [Neosynechococcus sphagnicola]|uniref:hypothetical protein n=1 Tax=Neosynechococcus sphagnicola TaxID=1501145 RepID=UPI0012E006D9|nr:hypothetical protein [Neosynechococcus sphagnicola]
MPEQDVQQPKTSWWNELLGFLWEGGFRSLIILVSIVGTIWITVNNDSVCKNLSSNNGTANGASLAQGNPICSKYFDLIFLILGGYFGISVPSSSSGKPFGFSEPHAPAIPRPVESSVTPQPTRRENENVPASIGEGAIKPDSPDQNRG